MRCCIVIGSLTSLKLEIKLKSFYNVAWRSAMINAIIKTALKNTEYGVHFQPMICDGTPVKRDIKSVVPE